MYIFPFVGTNRYFRQIASKFNIDASFVDMTDAENVKNAMKPTTRVSSSSSKNLLSKMDVYF